MCHAKHAAFEKLRSFHTSMQILMQYDKCSHGIVVRVEDGIRSSQGSNPDKKGGLFSGQI